MNPSENQNALAELDDYAAREEKAYTLYARQYHRQYPPPKAPNMRWYAGFPWMSVPFAVIALAGSALAAFRTTPVFVDVAELTVKGYGAYIEGLLAMLVVDIGVIAFRYIWIYLTDKDHQITSWVKRGAGFAFVTQLIAQLYAVREMVTWLPKEIDGALQLAIALAAALSGMVLAFVTGEILAVLTLKTQQDRQGQREAYQEQSAIWRDALTRAWKADRTRYIGAPPRAANRLTHGPTTPADNHADRRPDKHRASMGKPSPSEEKVLRFLRENPDLSGLTARDLEKRTGVNRNDVSKAKKRIEMQLSAPLSGHNNGHGAGEGDE